MVLKLRIEYEGAMYRVINECEKRRGRLHVYVVVCTQGHLALERLKIGS